jgi:hypothetical protein
MPKAMPLPPPPKRPMNFAPLMRPAPALAVWPPMPFRDAYRVGDKLGANWQTVAAGFGIANVWDLIWFNFRTTDPREINFYLHRYVGCWQSNDAKNFSFMGAEPGVIFIPPFGWKRPTPDPLMTRFLSMLSASVARFPYITYKNVHISRSSFEHVGWAVRNGKMGIGYDPDLLDHAGAGAMYRIYSNRFIFRDPFIDTISNRANVVHEATHAALDMYRGHGLQKLDNEFLAFLSEAIALDTLGYAFEGSDVFGMAAELAALVVEASRTKALVKVEEFDHAVEADGKVQNPVLRLREAIRHHPNYMTVWEKRYRADGN